MVGANQVRTLEFTDCAAICHLFALVNRNSLSNGMCEYVLSKKSWHHLIDAKNGGHETHILILNNGIEHLNEGRINTLSENM